jgi:hypothetical protein
VSFNYAQAVLGRDVLRDYVNLSKRLIAKKMLLESDDFIFQKISFLRVQNAKKGFEP